MTNSITSFSFSVFNSPFLYFKIKILDFLLILKFEHCALETVVQDYLYSLFTGKLGQDDLFKGKFENVVFFTFFQSSEISCSQDLDCHMPYL